MPLQLRDKTTCVVTAHVGNNDEAFSELWRLYGTNGLVIDLTYGLGWFWKKICDLPPLVACDVDFDRVGKTGDSLFPFASGCVCDSTKAPFRDECADMVVMDPPYAQGSSSARRGDLAESYNLSPAVHGQAEIVGLYARMLKEGIRILKPSCVLVVKCQDLVNESRQWRMSNIVWQMAVNDMGLIDEDKFVVVQSRVPIMRHDYQYHARKNHSYFWVFRKKAKK